MNNSLTNNNNNNNNNTGATSGGNPISTVFPIFLSQPGQDSAFSSISIILSFYAPIIVIFGVFILSVFSATVSKAFIFVFWLFVATGLRQLLSKITGSADKTISGDNICKTAAFGSLMPNTNLTYSTYILTFTLFYFIFPMILVNNENNSDMFNYRILLFFLAYIIADLLIKKSKGCLGIIGGVTILSDFVGGSAVGIMIASIMYYIGREYLFINETSSNATVCSMPSKQQFKCSVYKNGELISSSFN